MHRIIVSRGEKRMKGKREGNQFDCLARFTNRIILVERTRHYEARKSGETGEEGGGGEGGGFHIEAALKYHLIRGQKIGRNYRGR